MEVKEMKNYGEIAAMVIIESFQPFTFDEYKDKCVDYDLDVPDEDLRFVLDALIEREQLVIDPDENDLISLNFDHSDQMDEMALDLQFNEEVPKLFSKVVNSHKNIEVCFDYLPEITRVALEEAIKNMMK